jgi:hypothetical protein
MEHGADIIETYERDRDAAAKAAFTATRVGGGSRKAADAAERDARREFERTDPRAADYRAALAAKAAEVELEYAANQAEQRAEFDRLMNEAQAMLRAAGFTCERRARASSASSYYTHPDGRRVRLSDHDVPMTDEREHNRGVHGQPWIDCVLGATWRGWFRANPKALAELREIIADE